MGTLKIHYSILVPNLVAKKLSCHDVDVRTFWRFFRLYKTNLNTACHQYQAVKNLSV